MFYLFLIPYTVQVYSACHHQIHILSNEGRQLGQEKRKREQYVLQILSMMLPSEEEDNAPSAPQKPPTPTFKAVTSVISAKFKFQLDNLDINHKPLTDFLALLNPQK